MVRSLSVRGDWCRESSPPFTYDPSIRGSLSQRATFFRFVTPPSTMRYCHFATRLCESTMTVVSIAGVTQLAE
ncbi:MAG TPA: hypothetical protein DDZ51_22480 [Planctomycetaceae bacterium]|nr:hypothetical protein [Planctomycetaceae bacterium]